MKQGHRIVETIQKAVTSWKPYLWLDLRHNILFDRKWFLKVLFSLFITYQMCRQWAGSRRMHLNLKCERRPFWCGALWDCGLLREVFVLKGPGHAVCRASYLTLIGGCLVKWHSPWHVLTLSAIQGHASYFNISMVQFAAHYRSFIFNNSQLY